MRIPRASAAPAVVLLLAVVAACDATMHSPFPTEPATAPVPTPNPALAELRARIQAALTREGQIVRDLGSASAGAARELAAPALALQQLAAREVEWTGANRPEPCFAHAHATYVLALEHLLAAAEGFRTLAAEPEPDSSAALAAGQAAAHRLGQGTDALGAAIRAADEARVGCS